MSGAAPVESFSNYQEALAWLYALQRFGIKLGLDNANRLVETALPGLAKACVIHVAGTNGKGSVCAMIDAICRSAGKKTGLFTSPHLITFRERIRVGGEMIPPEAVRDGLGRLRHQVREWNPHPTFFELTTALALQHFVGQRCEVIVLETGLGGRLDATNAVPADVSVITPIDLDHEKWLGASIREIAGEKAGILKAATPAISAPQHDAAAEVLRERSSECQAPLQFVGEPWTSTPVGLRGEYQKWNAAVAVAASKMANLGIGERDVARGLQNVDWPARFQMFDRRTVVDGAHNTASARALAQTWQETFGKEKATLVMATLADKDTPGILRALQPIAARVLLPQIRNERATEPAELGREVAGFGIHSEIFPDFASSYASAQTHPEKILITGSLHFAGEALAHLRGEPAAFEECAQ